jgi:hypothetical protein
VKSRDLFEHSSGRAATIECVFPSGYWTVRGYDSWAALRFKVVTDGGYSDARAIATN